MKLEVRCCCIPQNLLGYIEVSQAELAMGQVILSRVKCPPRSFTEPPLAKPYEDIETIRLPIADFNESLPTGHGWSYRAVKSDHRTAESLSQFSRFLPKAS